MSNVGSATKSSGEATAPVGKASNLALTGPVKAALWVLSTDEEVAVEILRHLSDAELKRLKDTVAAIGRTTPEQLAQIHEEFRKGVMSDSFALRGSTDYLKRLAEKALGDQRAASLFVPTAPIVKRSETLGRADPDVLAALLQREHPQLAAAVLAHLEPAASCEVLEKLPDVLRADIVARIARLSHVPQSALHEVERVLAAGLPMSGGDGEEVDGVKVAATLLNKLDSSLADTVLAEVNKVTPEVANGIRRAMFTFEDLAALDRKGFQALLKEVPSEQLLAALKTASPEVKDKIFTSLSKRAAEMMREDLEMLGPQRVADVENAQQAIVAIAMQLKADGKITLVLGDGDYV